MYPHHERAIARLVAEVQQDPRYLALIIGGSIAKGRERPDSDVDSIIVTTEEEFARRWETGDMQYFNAELADWPGGYVEGKFVDRQWLQDAADYGSEPARAAFVGAWVAFSRLPDVESLLARIPVYPEDQRQRKMDSFYSQVVIYNWYMTEADKRDDAYLRTWTAGNLALFGGRLILAHNRILFPYHKWFTTELRSAPEKPADFLERMDALLAQPSATTAQAFRACIDGFRDWGFAPHEAAARFIIDSEWNWRAGRPPLADW